MDSTRSPGDESMPYGCARGMKAALDAHFAKTDPRAARNAKANSPGGRRNQNVIDRTPEDILLENLLKRARAKRRRRMTAERVARHRARVGRRDR